MPLKPSSSLIWIQYIFISPLYSIVISHNTVMLIFWTHAHISFLQIPPTATTGVQMLGADPPSRNLRCWHNKANVSWATGLSCWFYQWVTYSTPGWLPAIGVVLVLIRRCPGQTACILRQKRAFNSARTHVSREKHITPCCYILRKAVYWKGSVVVS